MTAALHLPGLAAPTVQRHAWGVDVQSPRISIGRWHPDVARPEWSTVSLPGPLLALHVRFGAMATDLRAHLQQLEHQWGTPDRVLIEEPFGGAGGRATVHPTLHRVVGVTLAVFGVVLPYTTVEFVHTQTWKRDAIGHGRADKPAVLQWAREIGYTGALQDEADALAIGACAAL